MKRKVGLVGYYQHQNYGDDLLAVLFSRKLTALAPIEVVVFDADEAVRKVLGGSEPIPWETHYRSCSCVIFGGGGVLGELEGGRFAWRHFLEFLKKTFNLRRAGIPYAMVAVGAGPVRTRIGRLLIRIMTRGAKFVCVRDDHSYSFLQHLMPKERLFCATDYALSLRAEDIPDSASTQVDEFFSDLPKPVLGVNIMTLNGHDGIVSNQKLRASIKADLLHAFHRSSFQSVVLLVNNASFPEIQDAVQFLDRLPIGKFKVFVHDDVWETSRLISQLDALFTMKLHFSIVAYALKVPVASVGYHPKVRRFFEDIGKLSYFQSSEHYRRGSPLLSHFLETHQSFYHKGEQAPLRSAREQIHRIDAKMKEFLLQSGSK